MTWNDWCDSEYNEIGFYIEGTRVKYNDGETIFEIYYNGLTILLTETIIEGGDYTCHISN